ncbi:hypothetical protein E2986_04318 [Frieseomelitta varia]|uniref:Hedgehog protein n=1 Tax=Frieseomelitta varia TaxID=561572 RepID=A0A833RV23_9HYME|nr:hypothetical protein E2986_04318 [Frieseomelitta varia]
MNQWPGVKVRVTEGWDEEGKHATDSLHYEGRAVDVTTSDRDRSKYGMLARLAVEAGFDWVYYESRSHIHCSVKSGQRDTSLKYPSVVLDFEKSVSPKLPSNQLTRFSNDLSTNLERSRILPQKKYIVQYFAQSLRTKLFQAFKTKNVRPKVPSLKDNKYFTINRNVTWEIFYDLPMSLSESSSTVKSGGCFPGRSLVRTEDGSTKRLDQVELGERIAAVDNHGDVVYSEVIAFLDRSVTERRQFVRLATESGRVLTLTPAHLVPVENRSTVFAGRVRPGDKILVRDPDGENELRHRLRWDKVVDSRLVLEEGIYAPLTSEGTVLVDDVVASCYAIVDNQQLVHLAFLPYRVWSGVKTFVERRVLGAEDHRYTDVRQDSTTEQEGILWYASFLYWISSYVTPSKMVYQ